MTCSSWKRAVVQLASTKVENDEHKGKKKRCLIGSKCLPTGF